MLHSNNCDACNLTIEDVNVKLRLVVTKGKELLKYCTACTSSTATVEDVYYGYGSGIQTEENIAYPSGHPRSGQAIPFWDKKSKKAAMKQAGVREAGDRIRGVRNEDMTSNKRKKYFT